MPADTTARPKYRSPLRFVWEGIEGAVLSIAVLATWPLSRRWLQNWGSRPEERDRPLPGDRLVAPEHETYTRAVSVAAPARSVWPWVVQFGFERAGFYSYELLERLVGIPVRNVESIVPDLQDLDVGDTVLLHPKAPGIPVAALREDQHLCFGPPPDASEVHDLPDPLRSWSIYIEPTGSTSCRLLLRGCIEPLRQPTRTKRLGLAFEAPIDFIMEQRMLRTLRRLAEAP